MPARSSSFPGGKLAFGIVGLMILAIVAAVLLVPGKGRSARRCFEAMAAATTAGFAPGAACPDSGVRYEIRREGDLERIACPDPRQHVPCRLRWERRGTGTWELHQDFPTFIPASGLGQAGWSVVANLFRTAPAPGIEVSPRGWWGYVVGPLLVLAGLGLALYAIWAYVQQVNGVGVERGDLPIMLGIVGVGLGIAWLAGGSSGVRETIEFSKGGVVRRSSWYGIELGTPRTTECRGVVALPAGRNYEFFTIPGGAPRLDPLFVVGPASLGVGSLFQQTLRGP